MPFDHFNLVAGLYNRLARFIPPSGLLDLLALPPDGLLLDVGGGTGRVAEALRSKVQNVTVVDTSREMLRFAAEKGLSIICARAEVLPLDSGSVERIIMIDALHHVFDQQQAVTELWRVLNPGGKIIIIEPDIHQFTARLIAIGERLLLMRSHFLSGERISALFAEQTSKVSVIYNEFNVWVCVEKVMQM